MGDVGLKGQFQIIMLSRAENGFEWNI